MVADLLELPDVHHDRIDQLEQDIVAEIARLKLKALGTRIDTLTEKQRKYLSSWEEGT